MEFNDNKAIYLQIADLLMDDILSGRLAEEERTPSVRDCAALYEVNVNTVVRSFEWLTRHEMIYQRRGMGFLVSEGARGRIMDYRRGEFFDVELPRLFGMMGKLGVTIDEVVDLYARQSGKNSSTTNKQ